MILFIGLLLFGIGIMAPSYGIYSLGELVSVGKAVIIFGVLTLVVNALTNGSGRRT
jgi:hypothetical protein